VVGGGITALELAEGLASCRVQVHYFLRGNRYWPSVLDEDESRLIEGRLRHDRIQLHPRTELAEVVGKKGKVQAVRTSDGRQFPCQLVAIAIGTQPKTGLARQAGLDTQKGILVNEFLHTSQPDILAAGDCAQVIDPITGQSWLETLWNSAREQGRTAGLNMAGVNTPYHRKVALNVTRLAGLTVTLIGAIGGGRDEDLVSISRGDSEAWRTGKPGVTLYQCGDVNRLRLVLGETSIIGALVMGDQALSRPLQKLISEDVDIASIRERLLQPDAPLGELITELWHHSSDAKVPRTE
jgi:NADPH-dependent 2,4-dienoyl-CoA reductase/sulfur reductase-like enzyme